MKTPAATSALGLGALLAASCSIMGFQHRETKDLALSFSPDEGVRSVRVESFNGTISVEAVDGAEVTGDARVWASGRSPEHAAGRLDTMGWHLENRDGVLVVELTGPESGDSSNCGSNLALSVPRGWDLVDLHTSNGSVSVGPGFGDVRLRTSNGNVDVSADGKVEARTSNGSLTYEGASQDFRLRSSNGNVRIALTGDWSGRGVAESSNGTITVDCSGDLDCALEAGTSNGKVQIEGPALDDGTGSLRLDTSNGSVRVRHGGG